MTVIELQTKLAALVAADPSVADLDVWMNADSRTWTTSEVRLVELDPGQRTIVTRFDRTVEID
jgi:hypothetical protein